MQHSMLYMKVLIKNATICCSQSNYDGQCLDVFIEDGIIKNIAKNISSAAEKTITQPNLYLSLGWVDVFAHFNDPGAEHKETIESGVAAAVAGGFTDVLIIPNTKPVADSKAQISYTLNKSKNLPVNVHPIAAVTKELKGKELAELYDMHTAGAVAFSDGILPIQSAGLLLKALQYIKTIDGTIIQLSADESLNGTGLMNEGIMSTRLGLPGLPAIAEELMIARDIELLKYTGSNLHLTGISTQKSLALIQDAKKEGLFITCSVTPHHLQFCDEDLENYDGNLKVNPPLRTRDDMMALRQAFKEGLIDCLASHHFPQHWDDKTCEFEYAKFGMIGLETLFPVALTYSKNLDQLIEILTIKSRMIFKLPFPTFEIGAVACLTLFNPQKTYTYLKNNIVSKSKNSAFINSNLKGDVIGIVNRHHLILKNEN